MGGEIINRRSSVTGKKKKKGRSTYAERDAREMVSAECFDGGRCGGGVANEHGGGTGENRDEAKRFEALAETRSELVGRRGELREKTLL